MVFARSITVTGRTVTTATTSTSTSSSSSTAAALVSKGEVDVRDFLLLVGSLKVDDRFLFLLLALFFILLLVDRGLLPLGINVGALSGLPDVELGSIFLGLLSLPLVQGEGLGLLRLLLLLLHGAVLLGLGVLTVRVLLDRGVVGLLPIGLLHVILEVAPVALASSTPLVLGLDPGPVVSGLPVKLSLSTATSGTSAASACSRCSTSTSTSSSSPLSVIVTSHLSSLSVALVVPFLSHRDLRDLRGLG